MLDEPDALEPGAVGQLDLLERLGEDAPLVAVRPRPGHLMLVEQPEPHRLKLGRS